MKKKQLSLMLVFALIAGFIGGALSSHIIQPVFAEKTPKPHERIIRAGGFEMVDEKGKMYAQLKLSERGPHLKMYGLKGGVVDLFIDQPGGKQRIGLYLINQGASIKLTAEESVSYIRVYPDLSNRP